MRIAILFLLIYIVVFCSSHKKEYFNSLIDYSRAVYRVQRHFEPNVVTSVDIISDNTLNVHVFDQTRLVSKIHRVTLGDDVQVTRYAAAVPQKTIKHDTFFA